MRNRYLIKWKSKVNGRAGRGTKIFARDEAERLAEDLNREYPQIEHEAVSAQASRESEMEAMAEDSDYVTARG
jgi:hypothetical protein